MIEIALLILTLATDGEHRLTLVETDNLVDCQETSETLAGILAGAGIDIVVSQCGETSLRLTPFEHGASPEEETHRYRVELANNGSFDIHPLADQATCSPKADANATVYCTRSSQQVITDQ